MVTGIQWVEVGAAIVTILGGVTILAIAAVKIARLRAGRAEVPSVDVAARVESLERTVQSFQRELAEATERLDFAERLLSAAREERRSGS